MKNKILKDISASAVQIIFNQICGIAIFYILSKSFSKSIFGDVNWALAVLMVSFAIIGSGIDQVVVRKTARGDDTSQLMKVYFFHTTFSGTLLIIITSILALTIGNNIPRLQILSILGIGQIFTFISLPFKQIANGKQQFRALLFMSSTSNAIRVALLIAFSIANRVSINIFVCIYVGSAVVEFIVSAIIGRRYLSLPISMITNRQAYKKLVVESLPQLGVILCNAAIARIDWILLGLMCASGMLAEYSFAYKAFEMSTLPLLIVAPLILPRITSWLSDQHKTVSPTQQTWLMGLVRMELIIASFAALVLNIIWAPVVDLITDGKYGAVNSMTIVLLSCCLPLLYINNILWSVSFSQGRMRSILSIFTATFCVNLVANVCLIPVFAGRGAALAYLLAMTVQAVCFLKTTTVNISRSITWYFFMVMAVAGASGGIACYFSGAWGWRVTIASVCYFLTLFTGRQLTKQKLFVMSKLKWQ